MFERLSEGVRSCALKEKKMDSMDVEEGVECWRWRWGLVNDDEWDENWKIYYFENIFQFTTATSTFCH